MRMADLEAIMTSDLPALERMTALVIASYINETNREAWPSIDTIAARGGMSRNSALRTIRALNEKGWLSITRRFSKSTKYQINHVLPSSLSQALVPERGALTEASASQRLVPDRCSSSLSQSTVPVPDRDSNRPVNSPSEQSTLAPSAAPAPKRRKANPDRPIDDLMPFDKGMPDDVYFEEFWNAYGKKDDRARVMKKWLTLTLIQRMRAVDAVPAYVAKTPVLKFRKAPLTWLNGQNWEDESRHANEDTAMEDAVEALARELRAVEVSKGNL